MISVSASTTVLNPRLTKTGHDGIRKDHPRGCCPSSAEMDRIVEVAVHFELSGPLDVYEILRMRVNDYPLARPAVNSHAHIRACQLASDVNSPTEAARARALSTDCARSL